MGKYSWHKVWYEWSHFHNRIFEPLKFSLEWCTLCGALYRSSIESDICNSTLFAKKFQNTDINYFCYCFVKINALEWTWFSWKTVAKTTSMKWNSFCDFSLVKAVTNYVLFSIRYWHDNSRPKNKLKVREFSFKSFPARR